MEEVSYEARKRNLKQAMVRIIEMDVVIELFWGDPMYHEALEDLKRDKERSRRDEKTKSHKKFLLALLRSAGKVRDTLTAIKGRRGSRRLYREACEEIAESRRTTGGYGVEFKEEFWEFDAGEGAIIMKMDEEEEMSRKIREKARYKGKDGDKPEWETTTDEEEEFQVIE